MGYQTEFTILNDVCHMIKEYPEEFAEKIYSACIGSAFNKSRQRYGYYRDSVSLSLGNHCNPIVATSSHHADDVRILIAGYNDLTNVSAYSKEYREMSVKFPDILDEHISRLENMVKDLKKLKKENQKNAA